MPNWKRRRPPRPGTPTPEGSVAGHPVLTRMCVRRTPRQKEGFVLSYAELTSTDRELLPRYVDRSKLEVRAPR